MIPFRFGPAGRQLYGAFHKPDTRIANASAVLLCNPFGQEAVRVHRLYRVLADRLARAGHSVLRFDYLGTGDADGDDETPGLPQWIDDLLLAHRELQARAGTSPTVWIGARLGAWLAARASARLTHSLHGLVLWEPVADGAAYLRELAQAHTDAQHNLLRPPVVHADALRDEAIGFGVSEEFKTAVAAISAGDYAGVRAARAHWVTNPNRPPPLATQAALRSAMPSAIENRLDIAFDWTSEEALNTALVPNEAVRLLAALATTGVTTANDAEGAA